MTARVVEVLGTSAGGVGVHVRSLVSYLAARGFDVTVAAPVSTHALFDFPGARVVTVPIHGAGREALAVPALRRAIRGAELVHAHGLRAGTAAVLARTTIRPSHRMPLVVTWHNAVLAGGFSGRLLGLGERLVARGASVNLGASPDLVERTRTVGGRDVRLAPVAPPRPQPTRSTAQVRAELGLAAGTALVVVVARLHPQKGLDVLVEAAALLRSPAQVVVVGDGPLRVDLQARIERTNAPVRLLGRLAAADLSSVADVLAAADLVVLPSRWEARPLVAQEAMTLGRPLLATDVGGVAGLVGDGARLVPPDDVEALTQAIDVLLADPRARAELGARGAQVAASWPDERACARIIESTYYELLGEPYGEPSVEAPVEAPGEGPGEPSGEAPGDPPELLG